ncbi:hypothetical protein [Vibrio ichthyoenteri]|nr:hypothetical protein [Vibrio ichthyoenteri]
MKVRNIAVMILLSTMSWLSSAQESELLEKAVKTLQVVEFADTVKFTYGYLCAENDIDSDLAELCGKMDKVPNEVYYTVVAPYFAQYVTSEEMDIVLNFWQSEEGKALNAKLNYAMETGDASALTEEDFLLSENMEPEGLTKFIDTEEIQMQVNRALLKAILAY